MLYRLWQTQAKLMDGSESVADHHKGKVRMDAAEFRPKTWNDYIGQDRTRERLEIHMDSAINRGMRMDHVFLYGPPGCGKTSLAHVIAARQGKMFVELVMPLTDTALKKLVTQNHGVVLLDELHRASKRQQESLLTLIEDGRYTMPSGFEIENSDLQIIGATTERGRIIKPLYDRFPIRPEFDPYTDDEMATIAWGMLTKAKLQGQYDMEFARALGRAAGGVPRQIKQMVIAVRDLIKSGTNSKPDIATVLNIVDVTPDGLSRLHVKYMVVMGRNGGEALGIKPIAQQLQVSEDMATELEDLLFERGYMTFTKRGRELTQSGWKRANELMS